MATVLVTGANKGVGLELTRQYALRGDTVLACCRRPIDATELNAIEDNVDTTEISKSIPNVAGTHSSSR